MAPPAIPPDDLLAVAIAHHRAGRIDEAESRYREILLRLPAHADANHNLGLILVAAGDPWNAIVHLQAALEAEPEHGPYWLSLVEGLLAANDPDEALAVVDRAIGCGLDTPAAHALRSRAAQAIARRTAPRAHETSPPAHFASARAGRANGPRNAPARRLAPLSAAAGEALRAGNDHYRKGDLAGAETAFRRAIDLESTHPAPHGSLGAVLSSLGRFDEALASLDRAIELAPEDAIAHCNRGQVLQSLRRLDAAAHAYDRALALDPTFAQAHANRADVHKMRGEIRAAQAAYARAIECAPTSVQRSGWRIRAAFALPVIPESDAAIETSRRELARALAFLERTAESSDRSERIDDPLHAVGSTLFEISYHGLSDRALFESASRMLRARAPALDFHSAELARYRGPQSRIRVGFLSDHLYSHTIGKLNQGAISRLDRARFHVTVIHTPLARRDRMRAAIDASADAVVELPGTLRAAQARLAGLGLDALHFTDIGMGVFSTFLAYGRYAPVQSVSWGHPDTSGLVSIDYFLSPGAAEPPGAEAEYTERLVRLSRLPCYYERVVAAPRMDRGALGLPPDATLYGCPQTLFKLHPDFDAVLARIVARDPLARIVLVEGRVPEYARLLEARWRVTAPGVPERVIWLPQMSEDRFRAVLSAVDVLVDPLHFGSGNTFYETFAGGAPLLTAPGRFMRARLVAAAYAQIGLPDAPVLADGAALADAAVAIANDADRNAAMRESLHRRGEALFCDGAALREMEGFLESAVYAAARGERLPLDSRAQRSGQP